MTKKNRKTVEQIADERTVELKARAHDVEKRIEVVVGKGGHYVVAVPGLDGASADIIFGPLEGTEAAELARDEVIDVVVEHGSYWEASEVPNSHWNEIGRVLKFLRDFAESEGMTLKIENSHFANDDPLKCLANRLVKIQPWARPVGYDPHDLDFPF